MGASSNLSVLNVDINNNIVHNTTSSVLNIDNYNNFVINTTLSILSDAIDNQFTTTTTYIDEQIVIQHDYTYQEIEALSLRTERYIQESLTQLETWATSDEGKRFRKNYGLE